MADTSSPATERYRDLMLADDRDFEDVMACVFGISCTEADLYLTMLDHPESTAAELADAVDRDRSNVHRSLTTLRDRGLVERERRLLDSGGHVYQHTAVPLDEAKTMMHESLDEWTACVHDRIDEFGSE